MNKVFVLFLFPKEKSFGFVIYKTQIRLEHQIPLYNCSVFCRKETLEEIGAIWYNNIDFLNQFIKKNKVKDGTFSPKEKAWTKSALITMNI